MKEFLKTLIYCIRQAIEIQKAITGLKDRPVIDHKFSRGEWHVVEYAGFGIVQDSDQYDGKKLLDLEEVSEDEFKANARLIAAAPKLLEIAEMYFDSMRGTGLENSLPYQITLKTLKEIEG
jgi:hypothetical protein